MPLAGHMHSHSNRSSSVVTCQNLMGHGGLGYPSTDAPPSASGPMPLSTSVSTDSTRPRSTPSREQIQALLAKFAQSQEVRGLCRYLVLPCFRGRVRVTTI